jgi:hypothetical protein
VVTAYLLPLVISEPSGAPNNRVCSPYARCTEASISVAPYRLSVSKEERRPRNLDSTELLSAECRAKTFLASSLNVSIHSSMVFLNENMRTINPPTRGQYQSTGNVGATYLPELVPNDKSNSSYTGYGSFLLCSRALRARSVKAPRIPPPSRTRRRVPAVGGFNRTFSSNCKRQSGQCDS